MKELLFVLVLSLLLSGGWALAGEHLSPPWWLAYSAAKSVLLLDPCLNVTQMHSNHAEEGGQLTYHFNITLCPEVAPEKAAGLATFLTDAQDFGGTWFKHKVVDSAGNYVHPKYPDTTKQAQQMAANALQGNPMFTGTHASKPLFFEIRWVEFKPEVIQFWDDNLADYNGMANYVAAELFEKVFHLSSFGLFATTQRKPTPESPQDLRPGLAGRRAGPASRE